MCKMTSFMILEKLNFPFENLQGLIMQSYKLKGKKNLKNDILNSVDD